MRYVELPFFEKVRLVIRLFFKLWWLRLKGIVRRAPKSLKRWWAAFKILPEKVKQGDSVEISWQPQKTKVEWQRVQTPPELRKTVRWFPVLFILLDLLLLGAAIFVMSALLIPSFPHQLSDSSLRLTIPTQTPTVFATREIPFFESHTWLSQDEASGLRSQEDVVNFAYLKGKGGVYYSKESSISFPSEQGWKRVKPIEMSGASISDTAVTFTYRGFTYNLNILQPFVHERMLEEVYIFDTNGVLWGRSFNPIFLQPTAKVMEELPLTILPNNNLSFTY